MAFRADELILTNSLTFDGADEHLRFHDVVRLLDYRPVVLSNCDVVPVQWERLNLFHAKLGIVHAERRYHGLPALVRILNHEDVVRLEDAVENLKGRHRPRRHLRTLFPLSLAAVVSNTLLRGAPPFGASHSLRSRIKPVLQ